VARSRLVCWISAGTLSSPASKVPASAVLTRSLPMLRKLGCEEVAEGWEICEVDWSGVWEEPPPP